MGILQKKRRTTGKKALAYRSEGGPKYRYSFSCLKVKGGSRPSKKGVEILRKVCENFAELAEHFLQ